MITEALLQLAVSASDIVLGLFGGVVTVVGGQGVASALVVGGSWLNTFLPVTETLQVVAGLMALYTAAWVLRFGITVWNIVRGAGA